MGVEEVTIVEDRATYAVDLDKQLEERRLTQEEFAALVDCNPDHAGKVVRGARPISLPLSIWCAKMFGSITLRQGDQTFVLRPDGSTGPTGTDDTDHIPNTDEHEGLNGIEHTAHCHQQLSEAVEMSGSLLADVIAIKRNDDTSRQSRVRTYKELYEAKWALDGWLHEDRGNYPDLVSEGERLALIDRGLMDRGCDIERIA